MCVSQVGEHSSLVESLPLPKKQNIPGDVCSPTRGTHISGDMFSRNAMCSPFPHTYCFNSSGRGTHFTSDMYFPGRVMHITSEMCSRDGEHVHCTKNKTRRQGKKF